MHDRHQSSSDFMVYQLDFIWIKFWEDRAASSILKRFFRARTCDDARWLARPSRRGRVVLHALNQREESALSPLPRSHTSAPPTPPSLLGHSEFSTQLSDIDLARASSGLPRPPPAPFNRILTLNTGPRRRWNKRSSIFSPRFEEPANRQV